MTAVETVPAKRSPVRLTSGNGYAILSACARIAERDGWSFKAWRAFSRKARAGTWEEMLETVTKHFDVTMAPSFSADPQNWKHEQSQQQDVEINDE